MRSAQRWTGRRPGSAQNVEDLPLPTVQIKWNEGSMKVFFDETIEKLEPVADGSCCARHDEPFQLWLHFVFSGFTVAKLAN